MANPANIVTPIAQDETSQATLAMPWFIDITPDGPSEFHPLQASYRPLVNGAEAFGAVHDAISAAKHSVDIVCWGFQPSMHFKRGPERSPCIGDLLIQKAHEGVMVRILCWLDSALVAQFPEASMPQYSAARVITQNESQAQIAYDWRWYRRARLAPSNGASRTGASIVRRVSPINGPALDRNAVIGTPLRDIGIEVVTRDFSLRDRREIMYRESLAREADPKLSRLAIAAFGAVPSHHQKMVLVDYEAPEHAVGFVMGHNMLDAYWDDDAHSRVQHAPQRGRNGATPRQDFSAMVTGPILEHLNVNFCRAWKLAAKEDLLTKRESLAAQLKVRRSLGTPVMAQITRTQSQEGIRNIRSLHLQAVKNATQFIYIENQYFRWEPLAEQIKEMVRRHLAWGRDPGKHGPIHLFVVTNATEDAVGFGAGTTYDMLVSLGRAELMPGVARIERREGLEARLKKAKRGETIANTHARNGGGEKAHAAARQAHELQVKLQKEIDNNDDTPIDVAPIEGLKVHICSLVAPDSLADHWMPVYVHSKIMIVDDVFLTHGSANINRRSMEVDSELNICHEHKGVTQALRRRLWEIHTGGEGAQEDPAEAFEQWAYIIGRNRANQKDGLPPTASLVEFMHTSKSRLRVD